jgi:hypothetical protein
MRIESAELTFLNIPMKQPELAGQVPEAANLQAHGRGSQN